MAKIASTSYTRANTKSQTKQTQSLKQNSMQGKNVSFIFCCGNISHVATYELIFEKGFTRLAIMYTYNRPVIVIDIGQLCKTVTVTHNKYYMCIKFINATKVTEWKN